MQVGEQHLAAAQARDLHRLRLLHLDDHVGRGEHRVGAVQHPGAGGAVGVVGDADAGRGIAFHQHLVAEPGQFPHAGRGQPDAVFVGLDLLGNTDLHGNASFAGSCGH